MQGVLNRFEGVLPHQASDGSVAKVVGRCAPAPCNDALVAPLSGKPCVHYDVGVWEEANDTEVCVASETRTIDFFLTDDAGAFVYVPAATAPYDTHSVADLAQRTGKHQPVPVLLEAFLNRKNESCNSCFSREKGKCARSLSASERCFEVGEAVAALGTVTRTPDGVRPCGNRRRLLDGVTG